MTVDVEPINQNTVPVVNVTLELDFRELQALTEWFGSTNGEEFCRRAGLKDGDELSNMTYKIYQALDEQASRLRGKK